MSFLKGRLFLGNSLPFQDADNTRTPLFVYLPKARSFIITTGSLAVSVTDMTAPVVGSSGGVYALVSAHLANVVMVSFCVCVCVCVDNYRITQLSCHYRAMPHHQSSLFWGPAGAALSKDAVHSSPSPSVGEKRCERVHTFM